MSNRIAVLASGRGSDLQSLIDAVAAGSLKADIRLVMSDKPGIMALERAEKAGIKAVCVPRKECANQQEFEEKMVAELRKADVEYVILAGFMRILSPYFVNEFKHKIVNIHPSLLPSFGGAHAHRDVLAYGTKVSGCTIHFVDEGMDHGPIIMQVAVPVLDDDTEDTLGARVLEQEHKLYPQAVQLLIEEKLEIVDKRHVKILK
jgi:phosphoribosylglycinamide formyltransferase-1